MKLDKIDIKTKNKNEIFCKKIIESISSIISKPKKIEIDNTSFKLIYSYAHQKLIIEGKNINENKLKEVIITHNHYSIRLFKNHCTLKNVTDVLKIIFREDNLPRCKKCGSRPIRYIEYNYETGIIEVNKESMPILNSFGIALPYASTDVDENSSTGILKSFIIAECSCGHQWKLKNFSSVYNIYLAYKEADK